MIFTIIGRYDVWKLIFERGRLMNKSPYCVVKTKVTDKQFKRFKICTILAYVLSFLIINLIGFNYKAPLSLILVCLLIVSITFWVYLWKCAKIVQKTPLHYIALCIVVPYIGAAWAYTRLRYHYDYPYSEKWWMSIKV